MGNKERNYRSAHSCNIDMVIQAQQGGSAGKGRGSFPLCEREMGMKKVYLGTGKEITPAPVAANFLFSSSTPILGEVSSINLSQ